MSLEGPPGSVPILPPIQRTRTFARGLWRIAAADVSCDNRCVLLRNGKATFEAMHEMIASARESIDFEQYIFRSDDVGTGFRDALASAAARGIRVRTLVDWVGCFGVSASFFEPIRTAGGEVRIFQPPGLRAWFGLLPRDHRKLLVTDRRIGLTGGIGIGNEWKRGVLRKRSSPWREAT